jgi:peptidoglycan hydrolase-like protein with peptidoglycan-binding domain
MKYRFQELIFSAQRPKSVFPGVFFRTALEQTNSFSYRLYRRKVKKMNKNTAGSVNRNYRRITACALFFVLISIPAFGQDPPQILEIRSIYQDAGRRISRGEYPGITLGYGSDSPAITTLYWDPATFHLAKIVKEQSVDAFSTYTEYLYYPDRNLAFIFERTLLIPDGKKQEKRYYMEYPVEEPEIVRYILDVDSERTTYDENTEVWKTSMEPFAADANSLHDFFYESIQPMLRAVSPPGSEIFVGLDDRGRGGNAEPVLIIGTKPNYWGISLDSFYGSSDPSRGGARVKKYYFTGTAGKNFIADVNEDDGTISVDSIYWDVVAPPIEEIVTMLTLPIGPGHRFMSIPWEPRNEGEEMARAESSFYYVSLQSSFSLPENRISPSSEAFAKAAVDARLIGAEEVGIEFLERKVFDYDDWIEIPKIVNDAPPGLIARVITIEGSDTIDILRIVEELTWAQGESLVEVGSDIYGVDLSSVTVGSPWSVSRVEWLSANKLLIQLAFDGTTKEVLAIFDAASAYQMQKQDSKSDKTAFDSADDGEEPFTDVQDTELFLRDRDRMNGPSVMKLQKVLMAAGYDLGDDGADGWFGPAADRSLRSFQTERGMAVTGSIKAGEIPDLPEWEYRIRSGGTTQPVVDANFSQWEEVTPGEITGRYGTLILDRQNRVDPTAESTIVLFPRNGSLFEVACTYPGLISWSPTGRRFALLEGRRHLYCGDTHLIVVDVLLEQAAVIYLNTLLDERYREFYNMIEMFFWDEDNLWFRLEVSDPNNNNNREKNITVEWFGLETQTEKFNSTFDKGISSADVNIDYARSNGRGLNIALNKNVSASSSYSDSVPSKAVDGNDKKGWNAGRHATSSDPSWLILDL